MIPRKKHLLRLQSLRLLKECLAAQMEEAAKCGEEAAGGQPDRLSASQHGQTLMERAGGSLPRAPQGREGAFRKMRARNRPGKPAPAATLAKRDVHRGRIRGAKNVPADRICK